MELASGPVELGRTARRTISRCSHGTRVVQPMTRKCRSVANRWQMRIHCSVSRLKVAMRVQRDFGLT